MNYIKIFQDGGQSSKPSMHVVSSGDVAGKIANQYGLTLDQLQTYNPGVNLSKIKIGQALYITEPSKRSYKEGENREGYPGSNYKHQNVYTEGDMHDNGYAKLEIIKKRYTHAFNGLKQAGYSTEDALRLAPILAAQSIFESAWAYHKDDHNYGGHLNDGAGSGELSFNSEEEFWNKHIQNLNTKWPKWNTAKNIEQYHNIINHPEIKTETQYKKLQKTNPDLFIYAPYWDGNVDYLKNMNNTYRSITPYIQMLDYTQYQKSGGSIHIKKKNKGKFTDYCNGKVTDECIQKGKHSSNPTTRKRATFADNVRRWKHQNGGKLNYLKIFN